MKFFVAFAAVLAVACAQYRPQAQAARPAAVASRVNNNDVAANVLRYDSDSAPDGSYNYAVEIDNGIAAQAQGTPRDFGGNPPLVPVVSQGSFSWISPEGQPISITYTADENGYRASGDAIPTAPAIPDAILKAQAYLQKIQKK